MNVAGNRDQEQAWRYIRSTSKNIFLTGKAGTGKTTFLKRVVDECPKRKIVLAPTGIAAINAGGMTIHSFFQLPLGIFLPEFQHIYSKETQQWRSQFQKQKLQLIRSLELLIIDEVSMLRVDIVDEIDSILKRVRRNSKPFGGVQLLMIGDMQQLPPVVRNEEWDIMNKHYASPYFFDAKVFRDNPFVSIEFHHIYRQSDREFIELLAAVRENRVSFDQYQKLNARYNPTFKDEDGYVFLSTHNSIVRNINDQKLASLNTQKYTYKAHVDGDFPESMYPLDEELILKKGAQVMFTKNDSSPDKRYVNGTLGEVSYIDENSIVVDIFDGDQVEVAVDCWENTKYDINNETKEIISTVAGVFYQYPLKTAWAITIHKSQGLTFDKTIIDAANSFSHGQVYVALSRCRTLEGIVLRSKISPSAIVSDQLISSFCQDVEKNLPTQEALERECMNYCFEQLRDLFDCSIIKKEYFAYLKLSKTIANKLYPKGVALWVESQERVTSELATVGEKFGRSLAKIVKDDYKTSELLQERVRSASAYFCDKGVEILLPLMQSAAAYDFDDKTNKKLHRQYLRRFIDESILKIRLWNSCRIGFEMDEYQKNRAGIIVDIEGMNEAKLFKDVRKMVSSQKEDDIEVKNPGIIERLKAWRYEKAKEEQLPAYRIMQQKSLIQIASTLPTTQSELLAVKGIGKAFMKNYGEELLELLSQK